MTDTYEQRAEMIRQMLQTYGAEINPDRIKGYLTVLYSIPAPALATAIRSAMENADDYPPGPGQILDSYRWQAQPAFALAPPLDSSRQLGAGEARHQIASVIDDLRLEPSLQQLVRRAKEIRVEGKFVPTAWYPGHLLSCIKAAQELGTTWKIGTVWPQTREVLSAAMRAHEAAGGDARWWWEECRRPTVTR